jgi:hypothetical protein
MIRKIDSDGETNRDKSDYKKDYKKKRQRQICTRTFREKKGSVIYEDVAGTDGDGFGAESGANVRIRLAAISKNSITSDTPSSGDVTAFSLSVKSQLNERSG